MLCVLCAWIFCFASFVGWFLSVLLLLLLLCLLSIFVICIINFSWNKCAVVYLAQCPIGRRRCVCICLFAFISKMCVCVCVVVVSLLRLSGAGVFFKLYLQWKVMLIAHSTFNYIVWQLSSSSRSLSLSLGSAQVLDQNAHAVCAQQQIFLKDRHMKIRKKRKNERKQAKHK